MSCHFVPIFVARRWLQTWRSESPRSMERHTCLETSVVWVFNKGWENNKNVQECPQIYLRWLRMHQELHLLIGWNWKSFDMRLVSGLVWTSASETVQQLVHDPWVSCLKKIKHRLLIKSTCFISQCFTRSLSRKATSSTGVFTRKPPPECQVRFVDHATKLLKSCCFKTLCVLHHPGSCSSQDSGATRTMRAPSILISLAGSAECTWLGHRSCHSELDMWKVFWHMHGMQKNCACFILIILEGSLNHYCCRYFPFCEICSLKKHCRAYVRTDSC